MGRLRHAHRRANQVRTGARGWGRRLLVDGAEAVEHELAKDAWVVESAALVQAAQGRHFVLGKLKAENVDVLDHARGLGRLGHEGGASLQAPAQDDLGGRDAVLGSDGLDGLLAEHALLRRCRAERHVGAGPERREARHDNVPALAEADELLLGQERVQLHLQHRRGDLAPSEQAADGLHVVVAEADAAAPAGEALLLERPPGLRQGDVVLL
mmetsp:Transcript_12875/g.49318  ORF Transcript_12875/g.49318 Transcript_12875/m.49318 type:complete len:212 (+) Transcript_12875:2297-2932(+)